MRTNLALMIISLAAAMIGAGRQSAAQDAAAFLAGHTKDCPGCDLAGAQLKRRNLAGANLAGANLAGASLHRAVLRGANLSDADLTDANLNKTDLLQANLTNAKLKAAIYVLHVFQKKTEKTSKIDLALAGRRYRQLMM